MHFIAQEARRTSAELASERGVFPTWQQSVYASQGMQLRNATVTSIAPTGTISIIANTSSSIEPLFALSYRRVGVLEGQTLTECNPLLLSLGERMGFLTAEVLGYVTSHGTLAGAPNVPEVIRELFAIALEIGPRQHLLIQAAYQAEVDNAMSKTINLPTEATSERVAEIYREAYYLGLIGVILLSPPQAYLLDVGLSRYHGSFLQFYTSFFAHVQLSLNPQVLAAYGFHLWFLAFLFLYSALGLTFFFYIRRPASQSAIARLADVYGRRGGIYLFLLPLALIQVALQPVFPVYQGWTDFLSWFVYFMYGYFFASSARLNGAIRQQAWIAFCIGAVSLITLLATTYGHGFLSLWAETPSYSIRYELYQLLLSITAWSWMIFVVYFGMRFLNGSNKLIQYGNEAVLPFYVLHYAVIVAMAYLFLPWPVDLLAKFLLMSTLSLAVTLALYEGLIRRFNISRRLFGMKLKKQEGRTTEKQFEEPL